LKCSGEVNSPCAKVLPVAKRLYGAKAPPARRPVGCFSRKIANLNAREFDRPERIWIVTPCHVGASVISLAPTFYASHEKSERAHFAAPPFHLRPASLGSQVVGGPAGGYFSFLAEILVLTALCKRKCGLF
jgi:hypothetical protein